MSSAMVGASEIYAEQICVLFKQTPVALGANLLNTIVVASVLAPVTDGRSLLLWLGSMIATIGLRSALYVSYNRSSRRGGSVHPWDNLSLVCSGLTGLLWGLAGALLFPEQYIYRVFLGFTIGGMCAGAIVVHSSHFPSFLSFVVPASLLTAARFVLEGTVPEAALAFMIIVFATALCLIAYNVNQTLIETFHLRFDLTQHARRLETANADLTEETRQREATQETLRQAEKMDALGRLTGGLAHDLNNLLTVIIGSLDLLRAHVAGDSGNRLLAASSAGVERAAKLTHSLVSFARRQRLKPELVNLNRVIGDFGDLLRHATAEDVTLEIELGPALAVCRIDPTHFQTGLLNLVLNSNDALPPSSGRITITTQNVLLREDEAPACPPLKPGAYVGISVMDNGAGMSSEVMAHAFEPFYTTKELGKGSGLGLSQVYGFVTQSGGSVKITSIPKQGTTVLILLPAVGEQAPIAPQPPPTPERDRALGTATILVVEDNPLVRPLVAENLMELGYRVITADDGPKALALLKERQQIDLLFSDVLMPNGMRGDELARQALELRPRLKVLLMSGYSADITDAPSFPFLNKPFSPRELADSIRGALRANPL
jgi:signal transduction histidine kinase/CheY-like chemotaxis protein